MTDKVFVGSGISEELIENFDDYKEMIKSLNCCICLDIVKIPFECENCESLYCEDCWDLMKISGKKCVINCTAPVKLANKFVFDILNKLKIKCPNCSKGGIDYATYVKHSDACIINRKYTSVEELTKIVKEKDQKIQELTDEIESIKSNGNKNDYEVISKGDCFTKEQIRAQLMTFNLQVNQKMELYNAAIHGNLVEFQNLINVKKYPPLEEVSAHNYFWTPLHYAMHYGQLDIILFILDNLKQVGTLDLAMRIQSDDGRCPLLCLLKSNSLTMEKKREFLEKILVKYNFSVSEEAKKEIRNRDMESLLKKHRPTVNNQILY